METIIAESILGMVLKKQREITPPVFWGTLGLVPNEATSGAELEGK